MSKVGDGQAVSAALNAELIAGTDGTNYQVIATDTSGRLLVGGTGASDIGKAEDAAHTSGDVGVMLLGVRNDLGGAIFSGTDLDYTPIATTRSGFVLSAIASQTPMVDDLSNGAVAVNDTANVGIRALGVAPSLYNGSTHDRQRANVEGTALASAARTATVNSSDIVNHNGRGVWVVLDATAASATPSVVLTIEGKDALSGKYVTLFTGAAVTGISTNAYLIYPGATVTANVSASAILPRTFRVTVTHSDADSITYSVGYSINL